MVGPGLSETLVVIPAVGSVHLGKFLVIIVWRNEWFNIIFLLCPFSLNVWILNMLVLVSVSMDLNIELTRGKFTILVTH